MNFSIFQLPVIPRKGISLLAAATLIVSDFAISPLWAAPLSSALNMTAHAFPADLTSIGIPSSLGRVEELFQSGRPQTAILIQDAHAISGAQRSIQKLIHFFQNEYGVDLVTLEGASTRLDSQIFKSFPDRNLLKQMLEDYFEKGELTGVNAAALWSDETVAFEGIEDWSLYEEGISAYQDAMRKEEEVTANLKAKEKIINEEKKRVYSKELYQADQWIEQLNVGSTDFIPLLEQLSMFVQPDTHSEIAVLLQAWKSRNENDTNLRQEMSGLQKQIAAGLKDKAGATVAEADLADLNQKWQAYRVEQLPVDEMALFLKDLAVRHRMEVRVSRNLDALTKAHQRVRDIKGTSLFRELEHYTRRVKEALIRNELEKELNQRAERLMVFNKFVRLEINREEWRGLKELFRDRESWTLSVDGMQAEGDYNDLLEKMSAHFRFYEVAERRDQIFITTLEEKMRQRKTHSAIFVSGGFHSSALTYELKQRGISYLLVTPSIDQVPDKTGYRDQMQGKVSWSDYFEVKQGQVNVYDAFVRAMRDQLLRRSDGNMAKKWRDQIIRDLSEQNRLHVSGRYLSFLDELNKQNPPRSKEMDSSSFRSRVDAFIQGLLRLDIQNAINPQSLFQLLQSTTTAPPAPSIALAPGNQIAAQYLGLRSESRDAEEFEKDDSEAQFDLTVNEIYDDLLIREIPQEPGRQAETLRFQKAVREIAAKMLWLMQSHGYEEDRQHWILKNLFRSYGHRLMAEPGAFASALAYFETWNGFMDEVVTSFGPGEENLAAEAMKPFLDHAARLNYLANVSVYGDRLSVFDYMENFMHQLQESWKKTEAALEDKTLARQNAMIMMSLAIPLHYDRILNRENLLTDEFAFLWKTIESFLSKKDITFNGVTYRRGKVQLPGQEVRSEFVEGKNAIFSMDLIGEDGSTKKILIKVGLLRPEYDEVATEWAAVLDIPTYHVEQYGEWKYPKNTLQLIEFVPSRILFSEAAAGENQVFEMQALRELLAGDPREAARVFNEIGQSLALEYLLGAQDSKMKHMLFSLESEPHVRRIDWEYLFSYDDERDKGTPKTFHAPSDVLVFLNLLAQQDAGMEFLSAVEDGFNQILQKAEERAPVLEKILNQKIRKEKIPLVMERIHARSRQDMKTVWAKAGERMTYWVQDQVEARDYWQHLTEKFVLEKKFTGGHWKVYESAFYQDKVFKKQRKRTDYDMTEDELLKLESHTHLVGSERRRIVAQLAYRGLGLPEMPFQLNHRREIIKTNMIVQERAFRMDLYLSEHPEEKAARKQQALELFQRIIQAGYFPADWKRDNLAFAERPSLDGMDQQLFLIDFDHVYELPEEGEELTQFLRMRAINADGARYLSPGEHFLLLLFYVDPKSQANQARYRHLQYMRDALFGDIPHEKQKALSKIFREALIAAQAEHRQIKEKRQASPTVPSRAEALTGIIQVQEAFLSVLDQNQTLLDDFFHVLGKEIEDIRRTPARSESRDTPDADDIKQSRKIELPAKWSLMKSATFAWQKQRLRMNLKTLDLSPALIAAMIQRASKIENPDEAMQWIISLNQKLNADKRNIRRALQSFPWDFNAMRVTEELLWQAGYQDIDFDAMDRFLDEIGRVSFSTKNLESLLLFLIEQPNIQTAISGLKSFLKSDTNRWNDRTVRAIKRKVLFALATENPQRQEILNKIMAEDIAIQLEIFEAYAPDQVAGNTELGEQLGIIPPALYQQEDYQQFVARRAENLLNGRIKASSVRQALGMDLPDWDDARFPFPGLAKFFIRTYPHDARATAVYLGFDAESFSVTHRLTEAALQDYAEHPEKPVSVELAKHFGFRTPEDLRRALPDILARFTRQVEVFNISRYDLMLPGEYERLSAQYPGHPAYALDRGEIQTRFGEAIQASFYDSRINTEPFEEVLSSHFNDWLQDNVQTGREATNRHVFGFFLNFYEAILEQHDRITITDVARTGIQPLLLLSAFHFLQQLQDASVEEREEKLRFLDGRQREQIFALMPALHRKQMNVQLISRPLHAFQSNVIRYQLLGTGLVDYLEVYQSLERHEDHYRGNETAPLAVPADAETIRYAIAKMIAYKNFLSGQGFERVELDTNIREESSADAVTDLNTRDPDTSLGPDGLRSESRALGEIYLEVLGIQVPQEIIQSDPGENFLRAPFTPDVFLRERLAQRLAVPPESDYEIHYTPEGLPLAIIASNQEAHWITVLSTDQNAVQDREFDTRKEFYRQLEVLAGKVLFFRRIDFVQPYFINPRAPKNPGFVLFPGSFDFSATPGDEITTFAMIQEIFNHVEKDDKTLIVGSNTAVDMVAAALAGGKVDGIEPDHQAFVNGNINIQKWQEWSDATGQPLSLGTVLETDVESFNPAGRYQKIFFNAPLIEMPHQYIAAVAGDTAHQAQTKDIGGKIVHAFFQALPRLLEPDGTAFFSNEKGVWVWVEEVDRPGELLSLEELAVKFGLTLETVQEYEMAGGRVHVVYALKHASKTLGDADDSLRSGLDALGPDTSLGPDGLRSESREPPQEIAAADKAQARKTAGRILQKILNRDQTDLLNIAEDLNRDLRLVALSVEEFAGIFEEEALSVIAQQENQPRDAQALSREDAVRAVTYIKNILLQAKLEGTLAVGVDVRNYGLNTTEAFESAQHFSGAGLFLIDRDTAKQMNREGVPLSGNVQTMRLRNLRSTLISAADNNQAVPIITDLRQLDYETGMTLSVGEDRTEAPENDPYGEMVTRLFQFAGALLLANKVRELKDLAAAEPSLLKELFQAYQFSSGIVQFHDTGFTIQRSALNRFVTEYLVQQQVQAAA